MVNTHNVTNEENNNEKGKMFIKLLGTYTSKLTLLIECIRKVGTPNWLLNDTCLNIYLLRGKR